ncbi:MAG: class I SAM-dependent methyltransferase [Planctomycetes bacterium]|nr:class I SAM-dependent methyltransferase [Planctomycetota bacterium]
MSFRALKNYLVMAREKGVAHAWQAVIQRCSEKYHERRLGIHSAQIVQPHEVGISNPNAHSYTPTEFGHFTAIFKQLPIPPGRHVFLDYGSGMGRVLILAGQYPFKRVLGIEYAEQLHKVALDNVAIARDRLTCKDIQPLVGDATTWPVPDDVTVVYFNNPFHGEIFTGALARMKESLDRAPRPMAVVLYVPRPGPSRLDRMVRDAGWLEVRHQFDLSPERMCFIYTTPDWK